MEEEIITNNYTTVCQGLIIHSAAEGRDGLQDIPTAIPTADGVSAGCDNLWESHQDQSQTVCPPPWKTSVALGKSRTFQGVCGGKGAQKKKSTKERAAEKPGVGHAANAQKTALVEGAFWLPSTPLTRHLGQDFPCSY